jgi:protein TonB
MVAAQPQTQPGPAGPIVPAVPPLDASAGAPAPESPPAEAATGQPELIKESYVHPRYPVLQRGRGVETRVILRAVVHPDGSVGDVVVLESSRPNLGFEEAAIAAVKRWRYKPGTHDGKAVDMAITINVMFR